MPPAETVVRVLVADDHPLVRQGLRAVLDVTEGLELVGETGDGSEAVRMAAVLRPHVVVMDLQMPGLHGLEVTRRIVAASPDTAVLVLTMVEDEETVFAALAAGARGYLLKGTDGPGVAAAVRSAAQGQTVLGGDLTARLRPWFTGRRDEGARPFPQLTDREVEVLDGLAAGLSNGEIGRRLSLSAKTVANNVSTVLTKLGVSHRGEAMVAAREAGLGRPR